MYAGYLEYAGVEIINDARAAAYGAAAGIGITCDECPEISGAVGDDPYDWYGGAGEEAPWWDPTRPESRQFLGVLAEEVTGLEDAQAEREPTDLIGDGVALGPLRRKGREMAFTVHLVARDEAGVSYGIAWLASALRGGACAESACQGDEMCMFAYCPISPRGTDEIRHLYDVGLMEGPKIEERQTLSGGGILAKTTFTLVAANPLIYSDPLPGAKWVQLDKGANLYGIDPDAVYERCRDPRSCVEDPECDQPKMPPRPPVPRSPCLPKGKGNFRQTLITVEPESAPEWHELVPLIELEPGSRDMRRLIVRFWSNPTGTDCTKLSDPCAACFDVQVPYVPKKSVLTVDGRTQRARVECPPDKDTGTRAVGTPQMYGPGGRSFTWPVFQCPTGICVEVLSERETTAKDAKVKVELVARGDAS